MQVIRGIHNIHERHQGCVTTIGNFDGLHLGHQALLAQLKNKAKQLGVPTLVILFEPQPNEFFAKDDVPRLMRLKEKILGLKELGIDYVLCLQFDERLASQTAEAFVQDVLIAKLRAPYVLVGDDFQFGYRRLGNLALLQQIGQGYFKAERISTFELAHERVSSTRIRQQLMAGNLTDAAKLLGKPYQLQGRVQHGDKRGRLLGFPTANVALHRKLLALNGVFVVRALVAGQSFVGAASIGYRPTFGTDANQLLEVHLLDFDQDIYGQEITVQFVSKLRDEQKYADAESLIAQIHIDVQKAREFCAR